MGKSIKIEDGPIRKRGRPAGRNRVPLSAEERRARNALYERERRKEEAEAMADLADALGCAPNSVSNPDLLAMALTLISRSTGVKENGSTSSLRRTNENLFKQIQLAEQRIQSGPAAPVAGPLRAAPANMGEPRNMAQIAEQRLQNGPAAPVAEPLYAAPTKMCEAPSMVRVAEQRLQNGPAAPAGPLHAAPHMFETPRMVQIAEQRLQSTTAAPVVGPPHAAPANVCEVLRIGPTFPETPEASPQYQDLHIPSSAMDTNVDEFLNSLLLMSVDQLSEMFPDDHTR